MNTAAILQAHGYEALIEVSIRRIPVKTVH
jgi:hypothetical protein